MNYTSVAAVLIAVCCAPLAAAPLPSPAPQTFSNLPLTSAEDTALARSPDVAIALGKVQEQQALFDAARAMYGPALTANYVLAPQGGPNNNTIAQRLTTVGAQVTLVDLLAYSPAIAQANASLRASQFDLANAQRNERINVIGLYYGALTARAKLQAQQSALDSAKADQRAAQIRFNAGDAPKLDIVRASVAVANAEAEVARTQAEAENSDAALAIETGASAAALQSASAPTPENISFSLDGLTVESAVRQALSSRPEIASSRESVVAEEHAVAVARGGAMPAVTVGAGYTSGVDSGVIVHGPSVTVNASLPLGGAARDRVAAENARLAQARAQYAKAQRQVTTEVTAAVRTYLAQSKALAATQRALAQASAEFTATRIGYRSGASSSLDVETARTTYIQALVAEQTALYAQAQARAVLQLLIGPAHA